jgi:hypothetical protein
MKKILILGLVLLGMISCNDDILDLAPQDKISEDAVWSDPALINAYHNALYNGIPHGFGRHILAKQTDECYANGVGQQDGIYDASSVSGGDANNNFLLFWDRGYEFIRKVNLFLENMETTEVAITDKEVLVAEAKFIRAFMYFELIRRYGGVPIVEQTYELGSDVLFERNTFEECVDFILTDLDAAMNDLPEYISSTSANFGRASQDACLALKSRLLLYAASPLFNESNNMTKWQAASDAAEYFLTNSAANYSLYPGYGDCFQALSGEENTEIIFARLFTISDYHQMPIINTNKRWGGYGGWGGSSGPSQNLVDDYDMINGEPAFLSDGTVNPASGYDPQDPYSNRDPRFDASIQHDETVYRGVTLEMWVSVDGNTWGFDSYKVAGDNPRTEYVINKWMPEEGNIGWSYQYTNPWIYFRLAEIYLNYAEAQFELGYEDVCRDYINLVRARTGVEMPPIPETVTGDDLRTRLYNERRIELVFEGHRYFDGRRWDIAKDIESEPIYGMDVRLDAGTGVKTYTPVLLLERFWESQMNLLPIHSDEMDRNPNLTQTPGW